MEALIFLISIGCFIAAFFSFKSTRSLLKNGVTVTGRVSRVEREENRSTDENGYTSTNVSYYPYVEFTDQTGVKTEFKAGVGSSSKRKWKVDQAVEVVYDPTGKHKPKIRSGMQLWFGTFIAAFLGVIFLLVALGVLSGTGS